MNQIAAQIIPDDALFDEVVTAAVKAGMHLITNGARIVVSPTVPKGWTKLIVKIIDRDRARLEALPCAA